ncbi:MAG: hypothetical protein MJ065_08970 [Oscillospiraceae bacterium]|nr:hypothetical protein [Oscillospiraceae bacterium]
MTVDLQMNPLTAALGDLLLRVSRYQIKTEVPLLRQTLCDGSLHQTMLSVLPCQLTLSGSVLQCDAAALSAFFHRAMLLHTAFSFEFAGVQYSGMQIIAAECSGEFRCAKWSLTLIGGTAG